MSSLRATLIGFSAILMWSLLAVLTVLTGQVPPFQLLAMTFAVGGVFGVARVAQQGALGALRQPLQVWALGVGGLFGYHALYFTALRLAPPAEAGLLNYFWPLLAVVLLGVGPVGIAFYVWDIGVKRGDIRLLGVASYAAPILSTAFLVLAGFAEARASLALSALLISGGGLIAASGRTTK
jgi:drug/metabolite transporter (DMT)-like permease